MYQITKDNNVNIPMRDVFITKSKRYNLEFITHRNSRGRYLNGFKGRIDRHMKSDTWRRSITDMKMDITLGHKLIKCSIINYTHTYFIQSATFHATTSTINLNLFIKNKINKYKIAIDLDRFQKPNFT